MRKTCLYVLLVTVMLVLLGAQALAVETATYAGYPKAALEVNGNPIITESPAIIINGRTYVPVRFVSEAMGASVGWEQSTRTVKIASADADLTALYAQIVVLTEHANKVNEALLQLQAHDKDLLSFVPKFLNADKILSDSLAIQFEIIKTLDARIKVLEGRY